jgi:hypothetical protein
MKWQAGRDAVRVAVTWIVVGTGQGGRFFQTLAPEPVPVGNLVS